MKKINDSKAFTLIELMVSIFITITIIASFYKLYESSLKTERSAAIRSGVDILGEQILDTLAESFRLVGLNSEKTDFIAGDIIFPKIQTYPVWVEYLSPYGSPITKVKEISGNYQNCKVTLFNSASFYNGIDQLYFHNQNGFFKASGSLDPATGVFSATGFSKPAGSDGDECKKIFPVGSLVSGKDFRYELKYLNKGDAGNELTLTAYDLVNDSSSALINFKYDSSKKDNFYSMPKFVVDYLCEYKDANDTSLTCKDGVCRKWIGAGTGTGTGEGEVIDPMASHVKDIIAVRFGFVLISRKERIARGNPTVSNTDALPKYCIFDDSNCVTLPGFNYTASVFSRVVYLSNYRFLKDQATK